jgi:hypothetical protein
MNELQEQLDHRQSAFKISVHSSHLSTSSELPVQQNDRMYTEVAEEHTTSLAVADIMNTSVNNEWLLFDHMYVPLYEY